MRKSMLLTIWILMFVLISCFLPNVNAETLKIGKKVSESEEGYMGHRWYYFDSGCIVQTNSDCIDYAPLIFDGNLSTGIDHDFGKPGYSKQYYINFPYSLNVSKIIAKPIFNGSTSKYTIYFYYKNLNYMVAHELIEEKTFKINGKLEGISLELTGKQNTTDHIYFNDIIIEYTPDIPNTTNLVNIQKQINKITQDINTIYTNLIILKDDIIDIKKNTTILKDDIIDIKKNITNINNNMPSAYNDSVLQDQINNLTQELNSLKENLTKIKNSIPLEYNDSAIKSNIFSLETENVFLKQQIGNLTIRINNLTTELEKLSSEVQNLQGMGSTEDEGSEKNDELYQYSYNILFGVIIIILLLIILGLSMMVLKKKEPQFSKPTLENGIYSNVMHEILFDNKQQNGKKPNDELNIALENKYRKGDMSEKTYNSLKDLIQNLENAQQKKR